MTNRQAPITDRKTNPTGLRRVHAAEHCGVSAGHFDRMVKDGFLPPPRDLGGVKVWLRHELDDALSGLPPLGDEIGGNSCDALFPQ